jgi:hypothetical protein
VTTRRRVLVVDDVVPRAGWGAGYPRSAQIIGALARCSDEVEVCPMMERSLPPAASETFAPNVRALAAHGVAALGATLRARRGQLGLLWVGRPHNLAEVFSMYRVRPSFLSGVRIVYDAEAVFASRTIGARALNGTPMTQIQSQRLLRKELRPTEVAHAIVTVSASEQRLIEEVTGRKPSLIGLAAEALPTAASFAQRRDLLFLGALWEDSAPNADSVRFFIARVMPIIVQRSDIGLCIAGSGSDRAAWLGSMAGPRIGIEGPVADLAGLFDRVRVFVAPTRYGAGIPHKVVDAARHGVPVVATGLIAAQLGWRDGDELLVGDTPEAMAEACLALYHDQELWERLRSGALAAVRRDFDPAAFDAAVAREAWNGALENAALRAQ